MTGDDSIDLLRKVNVVKYVLDIFESVNWPFFPPSLTVAQDDLPAGFPTRPRSLCPV